MAGDSGWSGRYEGCGRVTTRLSNLACPECGAPLTDRLLTNGQSTCECSGGKCRADWTTAGKTFGEAADKFVRKCETAGHTKALEEKIAAAECEAMIGTQNQMELFA